MQRDGLGVGSEAQIPTSETLHRGYLSPKRSQLPKVPSQARAEVRDGWAQYANLPDVHQLQGLSEQALLSLIRL